MTKRGRRTLLSGVLGLALLLTPLTGVRTAEAAVIYETVEVITLSKGVTFHAHRQVTEAGMLDIYVLKAPLNDPNITFGPARSLSELGHRETTLKLLGDNGAIAGVNGDFFDMKVGYAASSGPEIRDGALYSIDQEANAYNDSLASLLIDQDRNPFIEFVKSEIHFYNNALENLFVRSINKITDMEHAVYLDRHAMTDTAVLDSRFPELVKIVVEEGKIIHLSEPGELVEVPEDGFIIAMNSETAEENLWKYYVGQNASVEVTANIDLDGIEMAIGGGARILHNGEASSEGYLVSGSSRNPRTAVGYNQDKTELIIMVVDGRSHSVGATQSEMASLMARFGAYNAMNLDGGGSTTMAVREPGDTWPVVVNTFSEGAARTVVNALGIFAQSETGEIGSIVIEPAGETAFQGLPMFIDIYGQDDYLNRIDLDRTQLVLNSNDPDGYWSGDYYYPGKTGEITLIASYGGMAAERSLQSGRLVQIIPNQTSLTMGEGGRAELSFTGISGDGFSGPVSHLNYEMVPASLGIIEDSVFTAGGLQNGYIRCSSGDAEAYIEVSIGYKTAHLTSFEEPVSVYVVGSPETVTGYAGVTADEAADGVQSLGMSYTFIPLEDETQAAYTVFDPALSLGNNPRSMTISVYGDESWHWLRARLRDANGKEHTVDLAKQLNWSGWKEITVDLPAGMTSPVVLERIYVASLSSQNTTSHQLYFDNISVTSLTNFGRLDIPKATSWQDPWQTDLANSPAAGYDLTLVGNLSLDSEEKPDNYQETQRRALQGFKSGTARGLFAGSYELEEELGIKYYKYNPVYVFNTHDDTAIVQLTAASGGLTGSDPYQWAFIAEVENSGTRQVIIQLDRKPSSFTYAKEYQLFHDALKDMVIGGRQVFVVSTEGTDNSVEIRDGIRYINMGGLWNNDGTLNESFQMLRFRVTDAGMFYQLQPGLS